MNEEGSERILLERRRQIQQEGWSTDIDDTHDEGELAWAAVCYAAPARVYTLDQGATPRDAEISFRDPWPGKFDRSFDKRPSYKRTPSNKKRIRALEKAGALIAAEIERLLRVEEEAEEKAKEKAKEKPDESPRVRPT